MSEIKGDFSKVEIFSKRSFQKKSVGMTVSGPWDGAEFGRERSAMGNSYESEYRYEYPVKTSQRTKSLSLTAEARC